MTTLDVDGFEIDIEILFNADNRSMGRWDIVNLKQILAETVIENLTQDSKKRFEEYQERNDPCK